MDTKGFRLSAIKIEGFKGFTTSQVIALRGKHLFILGPNGFGKSSVVEGIRWGLFGSTRRPGETDIAANHSYTGSCRVELTLSRAGEELVLKRTVIRGPSGGSDAEIVDNQGRPHLV